MTAMSNYSFCSCTGASADEALRGIPECQPSAFKLEGGHFGGLGPLDGQYLLINDRQHLQFNAVELVKAGPGASRRKTLEELALQRYALAEYR